MWRSLLAFLLVPITVQGQYFIELPPWEQCPIPGYHIEQVIVACPPSIGVIQKGAFNDPIPAFLKPSVEEAFRSTLAICSVGTDPIPITIKVNRINVLEFAQGAEHSLVHVNIDLLIRDGNGWRLIYNAGGSGMSSGLDVTKHHGKNMIRALNACFGAFLNASAKGTLLDLPVTEDQLNESTPETDLGIPYPANDPPKGIYRTIMNFREGDPIVFTDERLMDKPLNEQVRFLDKDMWGYYDGEYLMVNLANRWVELSRGYEGFTGIVAAGADPATVAMASMMFGLVGGIVAGATSSTNYPVKLNMLTGELVGLHGTHAPESRHIIFHSRHSRVKEPLFIRHGEKDIAVLDPDTYCVIDVNADLEKKPITLVGTNDQRTEIELSRLELGTRVHLIQLDKEGVPVNKKITAEMRNAFIRELRPDQERPLIRDLED